MPLCEPLSLNVAGPNDSILTNSIWQRWWNVTDVLKLQNTETSLLQVDSIAFLVCTLWEESCHMGEALETRNRRRPLGNSQQGLKSPWGTKCYQHQRAGSRPSPSRASGWGPEPGLTPWLQPRDRLKHRRQLSRAWTPDPQTLWDNKCGFY